MSYPYRQAYFATGLQNLLNVTLNPLRSNGDKRQISLCNIKAFSVRKVMRIKDMITQHEFLG